MGKKPISMYDAKGTEKVKRARGHRMPAKEMLPCSDGKRVQKARRERQMLACGKGQRVVQGLRSERYIFNSNKGQRAFEGLRREREILFCHEGQRAVQGLRQIFVCDEGQRAIEGQWRETQVSLQQRLEGCQGRRKETDRCQPTTKARGPTKA